MRQPDDNDDMPIVPFRGAIFGANKYGIAMVHGPKKIEDCGMYIHVEDIQEYLRWQKEQDPKGESHG